MANAKERDQWSSAGGKMARSAKMCGGVPSAERRHVSFLSVSQQSRWSACGNASMWDSLIHSILINPSILLKHWICQRKCSLPGKLCLICASLVKETCITQLKRQLPFLNQSKATSFHLCLIWACWLWVKGWNIWPAVWQDCLCV